MKTQGCIKRGDFGHWSEISSVVGSHGSDNMITISGRGEARATEGNSGHLISLAGAELPSNQDKAWD